MTLFVAVFACSAGIIAYEVRQTQQESERLALLLEPAAQQIREATIAQMRASAHLTEYVLLARPEAFSGLTEDLQGSTQILAALASTTQQGVDISAPLQAAITTQENWIQTDVRPTLAAMAAKDEVLAVSLTTSPGSAQTYSAMIAASSALATVLDDKRNLLASQQVNLIRLLTVSLIVTSLLGLLLLGVTVWGTRSWILAPLLGLRADLQRTRLQRTSPIAVRGPQEFQDAMRDAEDLRRDLVSQIDETVSARDGLRQQAPLAFTIEGHLKRTASIAINGLDGFGTVRGSAGVVTGDWWDVFPCSQAEIGFVIADVVGHGERAAVLAMQIQAVLRSALIFGYQPAEACAQAVNALEQPSEFVTAIVGSINTEMHTMTFANAGHPPALHQHVDSIQRCLPTGPLISKLGGRWRNETFGWHFGDTLIAFTDGLTESLDYQGQELGVSGVEKLLSTRSGSAGSAEEIVGDLLAAARSTAPQWGRDDITCLVLRQQ